MKKITVFVIVGVVFVWLLRAGLIVAVLFIALGSILQVTGGNEPPVTGDAKYAIQSYSIDAWGNRIPSRVYFADVITYENQLPVVPEYWKLEGEDYKHVKEERVFTEPIKIVGRIQ